VTDVTKPLRYRSAAGRWVIAVSVLGSGVAAIDATVVGIALPTIGRDFHVGVGALQWVVTGYLLTLAAFLLLGGSLSDRFGRRRLFGIGVAWFAVASAACGLAPNVDVLIIMRIVQGVGAAMLAPGSLAILQASFDPDDRGRAIGAWSGLGGVATAAGPLLGGYLISAASWRWIFYVNIPISAAALALAYRHVPESRDPDAPRHLDVTGAGLAVVGLGCLIFALIEGPTLGWSAVTIVAPLVVSVACLASFVAVEDRSSSPMLPLAIFRQRQFSATNAVTLIVYAALGGALFLLPVQLQVGSRYSPLESGLSLLPITLIMLAFSARSGRLASRIGPRLQMTMGPIVVGAGLALMVRVTGDHSYIGSVLPAVLVLGIGLAITVAPLTATAMSSVVAEHAGLASAVNNDVARVGGLLAVAVLPAIAGITGTTYLHSAALSAGFRTAMVISAAGCVVGGAIAGLAITNPSARVGLGKESLHCGLDGPPLRLEPTTRRT
jgi:EmrB/QacA subfamily drug resistance transporter